MWMSKAKLEEFKEEVKKEVREEVRKENERRLHWLKRTADEYACKQVTWALEDSQRNQIRDTTYSFLMELIEVPPNNFIEELVKKINNVQLHP